MAETWGRGLMEVLSLTFSAAVIMGFTFGAGPCNIACLPYLGPVFLVRDGGIRSAWRTIVPFSAGRVTGYTLLGGVAGGAGQVADHWFEAYAGPLLGLAAVGVGVALLFRARKPKSCKPVQVPSGTTPVRWHAPSQPEPRLLPFGLFGMGTAMALNPCVPLGTVLVAAAATGQVQAGLLLGFGFGIGAVLIPAVIFGVLVAHFGEQIRVRLADWGRALEHGAAGMLIMLGGMTAMGWI